jgi:hypothetical protein
VSGTATGGTNGLDGGGATDGGMPCTTGEKQCRNSVREECVNGAWVATPCTGATPECEAGECVVCANGGGRWPSSIAKAHEKTSDPHARSASAMDVDRRNSAAPVAAARRSSTGPIKRRIVIAAMARTTAATRRRHA